MYDLGEGGQYQTDTCVALVQLFSTLILHKASNFNVTGKTTA